MIYPLWQKKEGMKNCLLNEDSGLPEDFVKTQHPDCQCSSNKAASFSKDSSFTLGYCLEFILQILEAKCSLSCINLQKIISNLEPLGECLVVVQENSLLKVHIHVKNPVPVINYILKFGEFVSFKLENMQIQHSDNYTRRCDKNYVRVIFITKFISCSALHKLGYSPSWLAANAEFLWELK